MDQSIYELIPPSIPYQEERGLGARMLLKLWSLIYLQVGDMIVLNERKWEHLVYQLGDNHVVHNVIKDGDVVYDSQAKK